MSRRRNNQNPVDEGEEEDNAEQPAAFDALVAATIAAAIVQAQAQVRQAQQNQAQAQFALTPALATQGTLDLGSEQGSRIYLTGTKSLYAKQDDPYDCNEE
jgi:hypothetical protein